MAILFNINEPVINQLASCKKEKSSVKEKPANFDQKRNGKLIQSEK